MGEKAPRRWYSILMIVMCIKLVLQAAISFRAAPKSIRIAFSQFAAVKNQEIPTHKSISRWLTQVGLYKLNCLKEQANDWALIIDNSVQIGSHKFLVILGVRLSKLQGKALTFEDMEMLVMEIHEKSDATNVCKALERHKKKWERLRWYVLMTVRISEGELFFFAKSTMWAEFLTFWEVKESRARSKQGGLHLVCLGSCCMCWQSGR